MALPLPVFVAGGWGFVAVPHPTFSAGVCAASWDLQCTTVAKSTLFPCAFLKSCPRPLASQIVLGVLGGWRRRVGEAWWYSSALSCPTSWGHPVAPWGGGRWASMVTPFPVFGAGGWCFVALPLPIFVAGGFAFATLPLPVFVAGGCAFATLPLPVFVAGASWP